MKGMRTGMETLRDALQLTLRDVQHATLEPTLSPRDSRRERLADAELDDVAEDLAAVDVRRTPHAGVISIGHPLGATGARITAPSRRARPPRRRYGLACMWIGQGQPLLP